MPRKIATTTSIALLLLAAAPRAPAPDPAPAFSDPTNITNPYAPFRAGAVKVFHGRADGERTVIVETHLPQTRVFDHGGTPVECCIVEEKEFAGGALVEISRHYLAQDDAGNVRAFGEVSNEYDDGEDLGPEEDVWLVGGATQPDDPPAALDPGEPMMFMPAELEVGDVFAHQTFPGLDETLTVVGTGVKVRVPAVKSSQAVRIRETSSADPGPPEHKWLVPGLGIVREAASDSRSRLVATSLLEATPEEQD